MAKKGNSQGITWIASSGDSGAAGCENDGGMETVATTGLSVNLPASIPEVTGVGGTQFNEAGSSYWATSNNSSGGTALSYIPEVSWNDPQKTGFAASGGGMSTLFSKPPWQSGVGIPYDARRDIPDVAFNASSANDPYFITTSGGQSTAIGGTSAATPVFAGIVVLLNQYLTSTGAQSQPGLGNINPSLYFLAQSTPGVFHDITAGNNFVSCKPGSPNCSSGSFGYTAGPGYDQVTGLGSIDANNLVTNWTSNLPLLAITALTSDTKVLFAGPINISVTIANLGQASSGPFRLGEYLTMSPNFSILVAQCDIAGLSAGANSTCSGPVNLPTSIQPGTYYLTAVADILNQVVQPDGSRSVRVSDSGPVTITTPTCTYALSSSGAQAATSGGNGLFTVNTQAGCAWNAASNANWIAITSGSAGSGPGTVAFMVTANLGAARTGVITVANQQFTITQSAVQSITLQFTNYLVYPVNITVNGTVVDSIKASGTDSLTIPAPPTLLVSFELVRPTLLGLALGDPMLGVYNTVTNPAGTYAFKINNQIGSQFYFAPFVTNNASAGVIMDVNAGLTAEDKCHCDVPAGASNVAFGYYRLFSNSNVRAYLDTSNYSGPYESWGYDPTVAPNGNLDSFVASDTGILRLTLNTAP